MNRLLDIYRKDAVRTASSQSPRLLDMLEPRRLQIAGCALVSLYLFTFAFRYKEHFWIFDERGHPLLVDFTNFWIVGKEVLHGSLSVLYDRSRFGDIQANLAGVRSDHVNASFYLNPDYAPNWPYPPISFFIAAPVATLPYGIAFISFQILTLAACAAVVYLIVRRGAAIAMTLATPFCVMNVDQGQTAFLATALVGAALLALDRAPVLAGVFIGCLAYKPQLGVLVPVALIASRQWRALISASITVFALVSLSIAAFGFMPWLEFPRELLAQGRVILLGETPGGGDWGWTVTIYGAVRFFHGGTPAAWVAQCLATLSAMVVVWVVWRSTARYSLKAAVLSALIMLATPYGWPPDLTMIVIPFAFLAADQIHHGLLRGEQTIMVGLFGIACATLVALGGLAGPIIMFTTTCIALRRVFCSRAAPDPTIIA